jgi:hypothetical protein
MSNDFRDRESARERKAIAEAGRGTFVMMRRSETCVAEWLVESSSFSLLAPKQNNPKVEL